MPNLKDLTIYLNTLKICNLIHQKIFDESHTIEIPSKLSESIVKSTLELNGYIPLDKKSDKLYDAQTEINGKIQYYEIKATSSLRGITTINLEKRAQVLVWAFFDFSKNIIVIKQLDDFDNKETLGEVLLPDKIKTLERNKVDDKDHTPDENFIEVFKSDNKGRSTITLDNFKWDDNKTKVFSMDNLKPILEK
jgi:hypothetical protein